MLHDFPFPALWIIHDFLCLVLRILHDFLFLALRSLHEFLFLARWSLTLGLPFKLMVQLDFCPIRGSFLAPRIDAPTNHLPPALPHTGRMTHS